MLLPPSFWPGRSGVRRKEYLSRSHRACACWLGLSLILLGSVPAAAQVIPGKRPSTQADAQTLHHIEGQVVSSSDQVPQQGVAVSLTDFKGATLATSFTDAEGSFYFYDLPEGRYLLIVSHSVAGELRRYVDLYSASVRDLRIVLPERTPAESSPGEFAVPAWALAIPPEAQKDYSKAIKELNQGNATQAVAHLEAALQRYPDYAAAHSALGTAHYRSGDLEAAVGAYRKALEIDEDFSDACVGLGALLSAQHDYAQAEQHLVHARQLKPVDWRAHYELGQLYWRTEEWTLAEGSLRRAAELKGDFSRLHLLLINVLAVQDKPEETLMAMENFLRLFPKDEFAPQVRQKRDLLRATLRSGPDERGTNQP